MVRDSDRAVSLQYSLLSGSSYLTKPFQLQMLYIIE
jgi:hypothetical protein